MKNFLEKNTKKIMICMVAIIVLVIAWYIGNYILKNTVSMESYAEKYAYTPYDCGKCRKLGDAACDLISYSNCEVCGRKMEFSTSSTDKLCSKCSYETKRCKHCGAPISNL